MRIVTVAGLASLALISLSACNRNTQSTSAAPAASDAASGASTAASAPAAGPATLPHRKEGLWEQRISDPAKGFTQVMQMCIDHTVEEKMGIGSQADRTKCSSYSVMRQLNGDYVFSSVCALGPTGGTSTSNGVLHGDFGSSYHMDLDSKIEGSSVAAMNRETKMSMDGKWLGPCAPGQKPGDVMVNGMKMNMMGGSPHPGAEG